MTVSGLPPNVQRQRTDGGQIDQAFGQVYNPLDNALAVLNLAMGGSTTSPTLLSSALTPFAKIPLAGGGFLTQANGFLTYTNPQGSTTRLGAGTTTVIGGGGGGGTTYTVFGASGSGHSQGLVPDPGATAGSTRFLCENAQWATVPAGATGPQGPAGPTGASGSTGATGAQGPPGTSYSVFGASGTGHSSGVVPDPGATAGTARFLCENSTWTTPPNSGGTVTSVGISAPSNTFTAGSAVTTSGTLALTYNTQYANTFLAGPASGAQATPTWRPLGLNDMPPLPTSAITSGTFAASFLPALGASGTGHQAGIAPDPGATAGTTRFLCENGTWATPPSSGGGGGTVTSVGLTTATNPLFSIVNSPITTSGNMQFAWIASAPFLVYATGTTAGTNQAPTLRSLTAADLPALGASGTNHAAGIAPDPGATAGSTRFLCENGTWATPVDTNSGGTVTSVGIAAPTITYTNGSAVTTNGNLSLTYVTQFANVFLAGPASGSAATPTWRPLGLNDMPPLPASAITSGTFAVARLPVMVASGASAAAGAVPTPSTTAGTAKFLCENATWAVPPGTGGSTGLQVNIEGVLAYSATLTWSGSGGSAQAYTWTVPSTLNGNTVNWVIITKVACSLLSGAPGTSATFGVTIGGTSIVGTRALPPQGGGVNVSIVDLNVNNLSGTSKNAQATNTIVVTPGGTFSGSSTWRVDIIGYYL